MGSFIGLMLGIASAIRRGSWIDAIVTLLANLGIAAPPLVCCIAHLFFWHSSQGAAGFWLYFTL
jgi:ABC-type dipeptide/oligopeptide/nickel transport system permease component